MERDRDARGRRYNDGEVVRYGAGESWRPTPRGGPPGDRSPPPRRPRSPVRERPRSPPLRERPRSPLRDRLRSPPPRDRPRSPMRDRPRSLIRDNRPRSPVRDRERPPRSPRPARSPRPRSPVIASSDSYVPGRYPPRRRSRSGPGDRFPRRERSRERDSPPRRRERTRTPPPLPMRRSPGPPRHSVSRRGSPVRDMRFERPRSPPRRDWERVREQERGWDRDRVRDRDRGLERRDDRLVLLPRLTHPKTFIPPKHSHITSFMHLKIHTSRRPIRPKDSYIPKKS
ncbi:hypothetical protein E4U22_003500 [Claviceps purpurea]|nr:hypothetical protein E4U38_000255 [Claviceps purpurea]KAG6148409.1 hypothetical protein E4U28_004424 [Claviceps purpurea]KAG6161655.1 hypothetical protein E4U51_006953 [Claviceps purpurea]KAG6193088.1 hypothetical protein E4U27_000953 [Claviceps purpurea]KAG6201060.1 hypothetical protein E4U35_005976 [Claviceps purpurea]